jgi:hypothetical protein
VHNPLLQDLPAHVLLLQDHLQQQPHNHLAHNHLAHNHLLQDPLQQQPHLHL